MTTVINQSMMFGSGSSVAMNGSTFQVGLQGGALKSVGSGLPAGVSVSGQAIAIKQAGAVLDGYDLRGYSVTVQANGVTIKNSLLNATGYHTITQTAGASGLVVEFNTFDGQKANGTINGDMVMSETVATIRNNEFFNLPADGVNTAGGLIEHNYFSGASYQSGAHADAISIHRTVAPVTIRGNYIDSIKSADAAQGTNAAIKIVSHFGAINDVTVDGNVLIGGGYNAYVGQDKGAITNVRLTNNLMGLTEYGDREGQYLFPGNHGANFSMSGNSLFSAAPGNLAFLGQPAAPPAPQPEPVAPAARATVEGALPAKLVSNISVPEDAHSAIAAPATSRSDPATTIKGTERQDTINGTGGNDVIRANGGADVVCASSGDDIIVGGGNKDWISGQSGKDVFVFTALSDSLSGKDNRDIICDWGKLNGVGQDTIDLHQIDADSSTSGDQAFSWIGSNAFSRKASELRSTFDGQDTIIEADVNGDSAADLQIQIVGRAALGAGDFVL
jgi:Ca2+-binding RTX toxin-like protein